jgi:hypothetical protein
LSTLAEAVGLVSTLCAAFNRRGPVGIGISSCSARASVISAATTFHSNCRIGSSPGAN